jgi:hypothetical protein
MGQEIFVLKEGSMVTNKSLVAEVLHFVTGDYEKAYNACHAVSHVHSLRPQQVAGHVAEWTKNQPDYASPLTITQNVGCPSCGAAVGEQCAIFNKFGLPNGRLHNRRRRAYEARTGKRMVNIANVRRGMRVHNNGGGMIRCEYGCQST